MHNEWKKILLGFEIGNKGYACCFINESTIIDNINKVWCNKQVRVFSVLNHRRKKI